MRGHPGYTGQCAAHGPPSLGLSFPSYEAPFLGCHGDTMTPHAPREHSACWWSLLGERGWDFPGLQKSPWQAVAQGLLSWPLQGLGAGGSSLEVQCLEAGWVSLAPWTWREEDTDAGAWASRGEPQPSATCLDEAEQGRVRPSSHSPDTPPVPSSRLCKVPPRPRTKESQGPERCSDLTKIT